MNQPREHNLSYQKVELDLEILIDVAASAVRNAQNQMQHYERLIRDYSFEASVAIRKGDRHTAYSKGHSAQFYGKYLVEATQEYAAALRTYFALTECRHRADVSIFRENPPQPETEA